MVCNVYFRTSFLFLCGCKTHPLAHFSPKMSGYSVWKKICDTFFRHANRSFVTRHARTHSGGTVPFFPEKHLLQYLNANVFFCCWLGVANFHPCLPATIMIGLARLATGQLVARCCVDTLTAAPATLVDRRFQGVHRYRAQQVLV